MPGTTLSARSAWCDRWSKPSLRDLVDPLRYHHRRCFQNLLRKLSALGSVKQDIIWYGPSWNWTLQFTLDRPAKSRGNGNGNGHGNAGSSHHGPATAGDPETLCYLVPNTTQPKICVPLRTAIIEHLPMRRLRKFIRDGITTAKCAVEIHWATWALTNEEEAGLVYDILRRKHQFMQQGAQRHGPTEN